MERLEGVAGDLGKRVIRRWGRPAQARLPAVCDPVQRLTPLHKSPRQARRRGSLPLSPGKTLFKQRVTTRGDHTDRSIAQACVHGRNSLAKFPREFQRCWHQSRCRRRGPLPLALADFALSGRPESGSPADGQPGQPGHTQSMPPNPCWYLALNGIIIVLSLF